MIETERLRLRRPTARDVPAWTEYVQTDRAKSQGGGPETSDGAAWRIFATLVGHWDLRGCGPFVVTMRKRDDAAIGLVGPWFPGDWPERELSWSMWEPTLEGSGYAFEAAQAVQAHVFRDLGWPTAVSYIAPANARSIALAQRLGCRLDEDAPRPGGSETLVFRHPIP